MSTLLLQIIAPLQSWGTQSHFTNRDSGLEPSKSGIVGIICAAMGRPRDADISDLARLRMGVRVDREGTLQRDFHIVQDVLLAKGKGSKDSIITNRYYLSNAAFLIGLEGNLTILEEIQNALKKPIWHIFFGRKSFPPAAPLIFADCLKVDMTLEDALSQQKPIISTPIQTPEPTLMRLILEDNLGEQIRNDQPLSFAQRTFVARRVHTRMISPPENASEEVL